MSCVHNSPIIYVRDRLRASEKDLLRPSDLPSIVSLTNSKMGLYVR